jgi:branched-chain amino acid transport system permease protein
MFRQYLTRHKRLFIFIVAFIVAAFIPILGLSPYYMDLFIILIVNSVLAMSFILLLRTGLINLGLAAFWGIGAYASTMLATKLGLSFWLSMPLAVVISIIFALLVGAFLIGKGSTGFAFVMLSSVIGMVFVVIVGNIPFLGGYMGITKVPGPDPIALPFLPAITFDSKISFFYLALFLLAIVMLVISAFYSAWTGRAWSAIGLNSRLAQSVGIDLFKYKLMAFVVASAIAGLMGSFFAHYEGFVIPTTYDMFTNIYIQIYAILGGVGFAILGPLVGAVVMTFFPEVFRAFREYSPIFTGIILVLLIMFLPTGLLSIWTMIKKSRENKTGKSDNTAMGSATMN